MPIITIAQINPTIGDFVGNLRLAADAFKAAHQQQADLLVFPELSLCGYYPADLLTESHFISQCQQALSALQDISLAYPALTALVGLPRRNTGVGKPLFNAVLALQNGQIIAEYHKQLLPTYNIFAERRHFEPGQNQAVIIRVAGCRIGLMICEDAWNDTGDDYAINPYQCLLQARPDLLVSINASPSNLGKRQQRQQVIASAAQRYGLPILYVNQVGGQDGIVFDGASFAVNADGQIAQEWPSWVSVTEKIHFYGNHFPVNSAPQRQVLDDDNEFILRHIGLGLQDYLRRCGFSKVVVGSSGGIDSALTIALAVEALGADNVVAITMPSVYSSPGSVTDSQRLCQALGLALYEHPIHALMAQESQQFAEVFGTELHGVALENLQARLRGVILMAYSNDSGALLLTTGNKSEISVGYCTLYGDTNGGLGLIGDLYKTEVYRLARYLNHKAGCELIPETVLTKPPSAELAPGQRDCDSLPAYEVLDEILKLLIEGELLAEAELQHAQNFVGNLRTAPQGEGIYRHIAGLIARNEYKRRQAPPIIRIRPRAFGAGRQMPISASYGLY